MLITYFFDWFRCLFGDLFVFDLVAYDACFVVCCFVFGWFLCCLNVALVVCVVWF